MALRARKVSGAFEKQAPGLQPGPLNPGSLALTMRPLRPPLECFVPRSYSDQLKLQGVKDNKWPSGEFRNWNKASLILEGIKLPLLTASRRVSSDEV